MKSILFILIFSFGTVTAAYADCIYDGQTYPTGTEIGGLFCQPDGTWQPKK